MALVLADRVKESSNSAGSGPFVLGGAAAGYQTLLAGIGNGNSSYFAAWDGAVNWLVFRGTFTSAGNSVSVDTVLAQSAGFTGFTGPFTIWGDSPASLMSPLLQMSATATTLSVGAAATATIMFNTNGVEVARFTSAGLFGIGNQAPLYVVDIVRSQNAMSTVQLNNSNGGTTAGARYVLTNGNSTVELDLFGPSYSPTGLNRADGAKLVAGGAGGLTLGSSVAQPLMFVTNNAEVGRFTSAGNLGIGITSPTSILQVVTNTNTDGQQSQMGIRNMNAGASASTYLYAQNDLGHGVTIGVYASGVANGGMSFRGDGAIISCTCANGLTIGNQTAHAPIYFMNNGAGIGQFDATGNLTLSQSVPAGFEQFTVGNSSATANSGALINLANDIGNTLSLITYSSTTGSGVGSAAIVQGGGSGGLYIKTSVNAPIMFQVNNGNECGRWHTNGYFGIGNSAPANILDIVQNTNGAAVAQLYNANGGAAAIAYFKATNNIAQASLLMFGQAYTASGMFRPNGACFYSDGVSPAGMTFYQNTSGTGSPFYWGNNGSGEWMRLQIDSSYNIPTLCINRAGAFQAGAFSAQTTLAQVPAGEFINSNLSQPRGLFIYYSLAANTTGSATTFFTCYDSGNTRLTISSNGGINNPQANNVNTSDAALKKDVEPLKSQMVAKLWNAHRDMVWSRYHFKDQTHEDWNWGYTAQEIDAAFGAVAPELIDDVEMMPTHDLETREEIKPAFTVRGVYSEDLHNIGHALLSEAQRRIEALEAEIAQIKKRGVLH